MTTRDEVHAEVTVKDGRLTRESVLAARKELAKVWESVEDRVMTTLVSKKGAFKDGDVIVVEVNLSLLFGVLEGE